MTSILLRTTRVSRLAAGARSNPSGRAAAVRPPAPLRRRGEPGRPEPHSP